MPKDDNNSKFYIKPSVTTDIAVIYNNKILLIKRKNEPYKDCYALPGGFLNPDEDAKNGALRELQEETGLKVELKFLFPVTTPNRDPRGWTITHCYGAVLDNLLPLKAGDDAIEALWFDFYLEEKDNNAFLTLSLNNTLLKSQLIVYRDIFRELDFDRTQIIMSEGIAFDHSKLIYEAIKKLNKIAYKG